MILEDLPVETLDAIAVKLPRGILRIFMRSSPLLWRVGRRHIFRRLDVVARIGDKTPFAAAIDVLATYDDVGSFVHEMTISGRCKTKRGKTGRVPLHVQTLRTLLRHVPKVTALSLADIEWDSTWAIDPWFPIPAWPVAYKLRTLSIERTSSSQGPEGVLALAQLGRVESIRIKSVHWWIWPVRPEEPFLPTTKSRRLYVDGPDAYLDDTTSSISGLVTELVLRNLCHRFKNAAGLQRTLLQLAGSLTTLSLWFESVEAHHRAYTGNIGFEAIGSLTVLCTLTVGVILPTSGLGVAEVSESSWSWVPLISGHVPSTTRSLRIIVDLCRIRRGALGGRAHIESMDWEALVPSLRGKKLSSIAIIIRHSAYVRPRTRQINALDCELVFGRLGGVSAPDILSIQEQSVEYEGDYRPSPWLSE